MRDSTAVILKVFLITYTAIVGPLHLVTALPTLKEEAATYQHQPVIGNMVFAATVSQKCADIFINDSNHKLLSYE